MATATTLTWKSALEVAERVYKSKEPLCINAKFQADTNLSHKATFEQLQKKLASLAVTKADEPTKKRLMVILGLTNPAKKEDDKEGAKAKSFADFQKRAIAASKGYTVIKVNPKLLARQKQIEISLVLFAHDFMKFATKMHKFCLMDKELQANDIIKISDFVEKSPDLLAFFLSNVKFLTNNSSSTKTRSYTICISKVPDIFFDKLKVYASHPDPEIRRVVDILHKTKAVMSNSEFVSVRNSLTAYWDQICAIGSSMENAAILKILYPDFIKAVDLLTDFAEQRALGHYNFEALVELSTLHNESTEQEFLKTYERLYQELQDIQNEHFSSQKEDFLQRYNRSRVEIHPQGANTPFPTPEELRDPSLKKEPEEKEKKKDDAASKAADSFKVDLPKPKKPRDRKEDHTSKEAHRVVASAVTSQVEPPKASILQGIFANRDFPYEEVVYDSRVKSWDAMKKESPVGFTEDAVWKHSCAPILEKFLGTCYSFRDLWKKPGSKKEDLCFCIIADVTSRDGRTIPGVFQFTFDDKGVCYHRWFGRMSNIERLDMVINKRRQEINFPPLRKPQKPHVEELDKISFEIDPFFGSITFDDEENGLKIKIYKVEE